MPLTLIFYSVGSLTLPKASSWVGTKREDMLVPSNYIVTCNVAVT